LGSDIEALAKKLALEKFKKKNEYLKLETFITQTSERMAFKVWQQNTN
jgi:hypothetical protein